MEKLVDLINTTELNAVVIDVKEDGRVNYLSQIKSVRILVLTTSCMMWMKY